MFFLFLYFAPKLFYFLVTQLPVCGRVFPSYFLAIFDMSRVFNIVLSFHDFFLDILFSPVPSD